MKRILTRMAVMEAVLVLGIGLGIYFWPSRISVTSWKSIRVGMTVEKVEEILGGPGMKQEEFANFRLDKMKKGKWDHVFDGAPLIEWDPIVGFENDQKNYKVWFSQHGILGIQFDREGRVKVKNFQGFRQPERSRPPIFDRILDWLGW